MINSSMDGLKNNFGKSYMQLVAIMLKPLHLKNSANTFRKESPVENQHCDFDEFHFSIHTEILINY